MRKILTVLCLVLLVTGCGLADRANVADTMQGPADYRKISAEEAKAMIDAGNVVIVDVRTLEEYEQGHIENAILLPDTEIGEKAEKLLPDKDAVLLVYCRSGRRSEAAARELDKMGYTGVYDFGGLIDWPYETVQ